jgi:hygromycin-B 4-O-kinase
MKHYIINLDEARNFLDKHLKVQAQGVELLNGGDWSAAYAYLHEGKEYVIRFAASKEDFEKDQKISSYATPMLRVPRVVEIGEAFRGYFAISERNHGIFLDDLDGKQMKKTLPSLLKILDEIRTIDLSDTSGYGPWEAKDSASYATWQEYLLGSFKDEPTNRVSGWREKLQSSPIGSGPFDKAKKVLEKMVDKMPADRFLIHGDLLYRNVLVRDDKIDAVIDWGNSMYGDSLYDVAWLIYWWPWYPEWGDIDIKRKVLSNYQKIGFDMPNIENRLLCYQIHIGLDAQKYNAFTDSWDYLARNATQTLKLLNEV